MKKNFLIIALIILVFSLSGCNALEIKTCNPIYAMDTIINIKFYNVKDSDIYYQNIKNIYNEYDILADDFKSHSGYKNIYDLNKEREIEASDKLLELVGEAIKLKEKTNGYFNPLIGRISHLWKEAIENKNIDSINNDLISNELNIMNSSSILIKYNKISIIGDANIDLGAIAKGYATFKAVKYLKENNIEGYLINAGESSVALGTKAGKAFNVALQAPYSNKIITSIECMNTSVATSSGKHQNIVIDNVRYHHIINPYTGYPSNIYDNVNVIVDNAFLADCYSTALFSMDLKTANKFALDNNFEVILYKDDKIL